MLANLRFWLATVIGLTLLVLSFVFAADGSLSMMYVWLAFTLLWIGWAFVVWLNSSRVAADRSPAAGGPGSGYVSLAPLTPEQEAAWGRTNISPLTPEQQAWVDKQKTKEPTGAAEDLTPEQHAALAETIAAHRPAAAKKPRKVKQPRPAAPDAHPFGVDHQGAELLVAQWMRHLRVLDAEATRHVQDEGIDVDSEQFVAQVKHLTGAVGGPDLNGLAGVAHVAGKHGLFFANTRYSAQALLFAERARVALFRYDAHAGTLHGENTLAQKAIDSGDLNAAFRS